MCANTSQNQTTEAKVTFIDILEPAGYCAAIATLMLMLSTIKFPSIKLRSWSFGKDLYLHPCYVLNFSFRTTIPSVEVLSVSLPGYRLRPRDSSFIFTTDDPSVVSVRLESGIRGCEKDFTFDCFPLNGQPQPPQSSQLRVRMKWHSLSWSWRRLLRRPNQID